MLTKEKIRADLSNDYKKHYEVPLLQQHGFTRKACKTCKRAFWTADKSRELCEDSSCVDFEFIETKPRKVDFIDTWKKFEKFFVKNGHYSMPRYPIIARWKPDLYFTIASIVDFQRVEQGKLFFSYPNDKIVVPQPCLRFGDIENVGVTGAHMTGFVMTGQHAFNYPKEGYWKNECLDLNFEVLTKVFKVPKGDFVYKEDVWAMPDFSAFGPCIEVMSKGNEIVNNVFMEFQAAPTGTGYKPLDTKVIDVGWGHERLCWYLSGEPTIYDTAFGPVMKKVKKESSIEYDRDFFDRYAKIAGKLNIDEVKDIRAARKQIAKQLNVKPEFLQKNLEPLQALYSVVEHSRSLAFAIADGGLPSNAGGGYNLRIILRRAMNFIREHQIPFTLSELALQHAEYLKPMYPELMKNQKEITEIIKIEEDKFARSVIRAGKQITTLLEKKTKFDLKTLMTLYESHGITPEILEENAYRTGKKIEIPQDFYQTLTGKHEAREPKQEKTPFDLSGIPNTEKLFYERIYEFDAQVIKTLKIDKRHYIILDRTAFYPEGGGQLFDIGQIDNAHVIQVQKIGDVVIHEIDNELKKKNVHCIINKERRESLRRHHSAAHLLNGAAKKLLGNHVWQAGAEKTPEKGRLDITHYDSLSNEELQKIEDMANQVIHEKRPVANPVLPRLEAEKKYGFTLYQGGAVPGKQLRIVDIKDWDVEACGGTHVSNTGEIECVKITKAKKIQDGIIRLEYVAGNTLCAKADKTQVNTEFDESDRWIKEVDAMLKTKNQLTGEIDFIDFDSATLEELQEKFKSLKKELAEIRNRIVHSIDTASPVQYLQDADMKTLQEMAEKILEHHAFTVLLSNGMVLGKGKHAGLENVVEKCAEIMGGKAGGKPGEYKGGGPYAEKTKDAFEFAKKQLV